MDLERQHEETQKIVEKISANLEQLIRQLNAFKPASAENVGELQKQLSEKMAQQLLVQEQRMDLLSNSLQEQKKSVFDSAGLLQDLLIGIENLGDNVKNIQKEMGVWRDPEVMEAEENLKRLHDEVPLSVLAEKGPGIVPISAPKNLSQFPAQR